MQAARNLASCGGTLGTAACTPAAGSLDTIATPSLDCSTAGMLVYPDGCLTARYPICLGAVTDAKEVLASLLGVPEKDPNDGHFANIGHTILGVRLSPAAEHVPECLYL